MFRKPWIAASLIFVPWAITASADDVTIETDPNTGQRYHVTRQLVNRPVTETHYEPRQYTAYRERYTTDMQEQTRTYQVPVTQQQWVPGYQKTWNLLAPPVLSYRLMPVTRLETRTETVRVPVTRREMIPQQLTQHVPVTNTYTVTDEHTHRVALGKTQGGTVAVASNNNNGGVGTQSTPAEGAGAPSDASRDGSDDPISRHR